MASVRTFPVLWHEKLGRPLIKWLTSGITLQLFMEISLLLLIHLPWTPFPLLMTSPAVQLLLLTQRQQYILLRERINGAPLGGRRTLFLATPLPLLVPVTLPTSITIQFPLHTARATPPNLLTAATIRPQLVLPQLLLNVPDGLPTRTRQKIRAIPLRGYVA